VENGQIHYRGVVNCWYVRRFGHHAWHWWLWSFPCLLHFPLIRSSLDTQTWLHSNNKPYQQWRQHQPYQQHSLALPSGNPYLSQPTTNGALTLPGPFVTSIRFIHSTTNRTQAFVTAYHFQCCCRFIVPFKLCYIYPCTSHIWATAYHCHRRHHTHPSKHCRNSEFRLLPRIQTFVLTVL